MGASSSSLADVRKWDDFYLKVGRGKVNVNAADKEGMTALHHAARSGNADVITCLIKMGASLENTTSTGKTPLMLAVQRKKLDAVAVLLDAGADVASEDKDGDTPLHYAAQQGFSDAIVTLVEFGGDMDAVNRFGWTPLHKAALLRGRMPASAIRLVELGADVGIRTKNGTLAADIARTSGCADLAAWLDDELAKGRPKRCPRRFAQKRGVARDQAEASLPVHSPMPPPMTSVIWNPPQPTVKTELPLRKEAYYASHHKSAPPVLGYEMNKAKLRSANSDSALIDPEIYDTLTEQLFPVFESLGLRDKLPAAVEWCQLQGAENIDDIMEDDGCASDLADALRLPRIKRNKLVSRLACEDRESVRIRSL